VFESGEYPQEATTAARRTLDVAGSRTRAPGTSGPAPHAPADGRAARTGLPQIVMSIFDDAGNPHYSGGGPVVVHEVARRLARRYRVTVVSASYKGSKSQWRDGVRYLFLPVGWAGPRAGQLLFQFLLPFVALVLRHDLWIETLPPPISSSLLPLMSRKPVIALVQMLSAADMARRYKLPFQFLERFGLKLYRHFIVLNEVDRSAVRRHNKTATCVLIPNGADRPDVDESELGGGDHVLFLGRIDVEQKGLDLLLSAVAQHRPALPLIIAGSGTKREERKLQQLADQAGVQATVLGRVGGRTKENLLRTCACLVVPSRYETFSLSALEAMTYGKPIVCFDLPQLGWINADCAVRVPPFDVAGMGQALQDLAADPAHRADLGRQGRILSRDYDWDVLGERYREVVQTVLETTRQKSAP
jgi:phosphatidyl-myo-inositol alpha-mannosyltransferase